MGLNVEISVLVVDARTIQMTAVLICLESWILHGKVFASKLLTNSRYKHLLNLPRTDYKNWAYGLKAAGYATDNNYAVKLIAIIENLKLNQYDF